MFPTLSHIIEYLFGVNVKLPVQTFGFFEAMAFVLAFIVFRSEFKRKEQLGRIRSFKKFVIIGKPASAAELVFNSVIGFIVGFKLAGVLLNYTVFAVNPVRFIFSLQGNIPGGLFIALLFFYLTYQGKRDEQLPVPETVEKDVHPYQLMPTITLWCAFWGFIGAKFFSCLENWGDFMHNPWQQLFSITGWTFYGGLIFGALAYLIYGYRRGMKLIDLADIGSPGMMLAYAVGRIGCQLSGDGDWGVVSLSPKPSMLSWTPDWVWSFKFPHNVINSGIPINNCSGNYCHQLVYGVFPTSFYEVLICTGLFLILWTLRKRITIPGVMVFLYFLLNGLERLLIEQIKVNQHYYIGKFAFTQAELVGLCLLIGGVTGLVIIFLKRKPAFSMSDFNM